MNPQLTAAEHGYGTRRQSGGCPSAGARRAAPRDVPPLAARLSVPPAHALAPTFPSKSHGFEAPVQECGPHSG